MAHTLVADELAVKAQTRDRRAQIMAHRR
jgi:hypothetical protein